MSKQRKISGVKAVITLALIGLGLVIIFAYLRSRDPAADEVMPVLGDITTYYSFSGTVEARDRELVLADRMMQIAEVFVQAGQQVSTGDALVKTSLGQVIRASIAGEVSKVLVEENAQVLAGSPLADIVDYSNLQLRVMVDEYDLSALEEGKEAVITIHALDKDVTGTVISVAREGVNTNGVTIFDAVISLDTQEAVRIGMSAEARMVNQNVRDVLTLPVTAIQFDNKNRPYVYVKSENGPGEMRELSLGVNDGMSVEVLAGLAQDDVVLVPRKDRRFDFRGFHEGN